LINLCNEIRSGQRREIEQMESVGTRLAQASQRGSS
jgi:hypothetical protein